MEQLVKQKKIPVCNLTFKIRLVTILGWKNLETYSLHHNSYFYYSFKTRYHTVKYAIYISCLKPKLYHFGGKS